MGRCAQCNEINAAQAQFCQSCGAELRIAGTDTGRRNVTVVFVDIVESTAMGERLDPELVRDIQTRYFDVVRGAVEKHGGLVEKYIGDAVMAVFGAVELHEDDALRATRAAAAIRDAVEDQVHSDNESRPRLRVRVGVCTGQVAIGHPTSGHGFVSGDTVNTAARLEQSAQPGEVLLSATTLEHVRHAVRVEALPSVELRGKVDPVMAFRLLEVHGSTPDRPFSGSLVGRERELEVLRGAFARAAHERRVVVVTVSGMAGIGKSRLIGEFVADLSSSAAVLHGHCLSYGDPIGLVPVAQWVCQGAGISADQAREVGLRLLADHMSDLPDRDAVAARAAGAIGLWGETGDADEGFWAIRRLLEQLARERPLVATIEDLQWAQPTLFNLLEYVAEFAADAPMLIVASARDELARLRPDWGTGEAHVVLALDALDTEATDALISGVLDGDRLAPDVATALRRVSGGNPLFLQETLLSWIEKGLLRVQRGQWRTSDTAAQLPVPESIGALLAARIGRLPLDERDVLTRASIVGELFSWGAVRALLQGRLEAGAGGPLISLMRRGEIAPVRSSLTGEEAFRFRHVLLRDAAYEGLPKATRAELHERYATWLEQIGRRGELPTFDESAGLHLDLAVRYRHDIGLHDERTVAIADAAVDYLERAGRRAEAFGDGQGAVKLFDRALDLVPTDMATRARLLFAVRGLVGWVVDDARCDNVDAELERISNDRQLPAIHELLQLERFMVGLYYGQPAIDLDAAREQAVRAVAAAEEMSEDFYLVESLRSLAELAWTAGSIAEALQATERGLDVARRTASRVPSVVYTLVALMEYGPTPVDRAIDRAHQLLVDVGASSWAEYRLLAHLALFNGMRGDLAAFRSHAARVAAFLQEIPLDSQLRAELLWILGQSYAIAGDLESSAVMLTESWGHWLAHGHTANMGMLGWDLGRTLTDLGRYDEATEVARVVESSAPSFDVWAQAAWRGVLARAALDGGRLEEADRLSAEASEIAEGTDFLLMRADISIDRARVVYALGRGAEATQLAKLAVQLYEQKGSVAAAAAARSVAAALDS